MTWGRGLRIADKRAPNVAEEGQEGPTTRKQNSYSTRGDLDSRRDFDQHQPPGASVTFAQRIGLPAAVELLTTLAAAGGFGRNFV